MTSVPTAVRRVAGAVSSRHRRERRLLESCALEPTRLPEPLIEPGRNSVIICGCPHSGTALLTAALHQPPAMVTVMEPWDGLRLPPAELFSSLRHELNQGELRRGRLDLDSLTDDGTVAWTVDGHRTYPVESTTDTLLGVEWPTFWQYLPMLSTTRFVVGVRHPADVVASFVAQPGRLDAGYDHDVAFNRRLNHELAACESDEDRRLALYDRVYTTVLLYAHQPNVHLVRYEDWGTAAGAVLDGLSQFLDRDLHHSLATVRVVPSGDHPSRQAIADRSTTARALGY